MPAALAAGMMGADYSVTLAVQSPPGAPTWSITSGALPGGLTLGTATGVLSGVPEASGTFTFTVRADAGGRQGFQAFTLTVNQPNVSITAAANHLLAGDQLDAALQRFLDFQGNHNGRYDVGDFRAYLRAQGHLPAAMSARKGAPCTRAWLWRPQSYSRPRRVRTLPHRRRRASSRSRSSPPTPTTAPWRWCSRDLA